MNNTAKVVDHGPELCSGFGQYHSDQGATPRPYAGLSLDQVGGLVYLPQCVDKGAAQWAIFSTLKSRSKKAQEERGFFYALWADIDENPIPLNILSDNVKAMLGDVRYFTYTSKSATEENQKARIIIPLASFIDGGKYPLYQQILNDVLEENGVTPDRKTEPVNQICYLPNEGGFYDAYINDGQALFEPKSWQGLVAAKQEELSKQAEVKTKRLEQSRLKAKERLNAGIESPIDAFNQAYSIRLLFENYGYKQFRSRWLSPNSESGVAGVTLSDDESKWYSQHGSDSAIGQNGFGDAFDLYTYYEHRNDRNAAIKAAAAMFEVNAPQPLDERQSAPEMGTSPQLFDLNVFALNGTSQEMKSQMLEDKFILGSLALLGQATAIYAQPNAGKTLLTIWLLIEAIKSGTLDPENVFYLNCDDNHKGLAYKLELAEKWGFRMLAPGYPISQPFKAEMLDAILKKLVSQQTAKGKVLILDTLKKFVDLMNKKSGADFGQTVREFVTHGGSVILLAHVNKHKSEEGKVIYSGTSDIVDDIDCAYTLDVIQQDELSKTARFENFKNRGDVAQTATYQYPTRGDYSSLLQFTKHIDPDQEKRLINRKRINDQLRDNEEVIDSATGCLSEGIIRKTELIKEIQNRTDLSRRTISKALKDHTGTDYEQGHRWRVRIMEKNSHVYEALPQTHAKAGG